MPATPPAYRNGFGYVGRIITWQDYLSPYNLTAADSQIGQAVGCRIKALPDRPAILDSLYIPQPFYLAGSNQAWSVRLGVFRGEPLSNLLPFQQAVNYAPANPGANLVGEMLFEDWWVANSAAATTFRRNYEFPNGSGPSVGPNEVMTIVMAIMYNNPTIGYGVNNQTYMALTANGRGDGVTAADRAMPAPSAENNKVRSIPRGSF